jgi:hypothetical protein
MCTVWWRHVLNAPTVKKGLRRYPQQFDVSSSTRRSARSGGAFVSAHVIWIDRQKPIFHLHQTAEISASTHAGRT